jgi:hypothetical protein
MNAMSHSELAAVALAKEEAKKAMRGFIYIEDAAEITGNSVRTMEREIADGKLPAFYLRAKKIVFIDDFNQYLGGLEPVVLRPSGRKNLARHVRFRAGPPLATVEPDVRQPAE